MSPSIDRYSNRTGATERARIIVAHEGFIEDLHFPEVMNRDGFPADDGTRKIFRSVKSDTFGQLYGNGD
jgi:hypothetical protein